MPLDPVLAWTVRLAAAGLLAAAAAVKLAALEPFVGVVRDYRLLPERLARPVAYVIPPLELGLALALLLLPGSGLPALAASLLLASLASAMGMNLARGRADIDCGCFAGLTRQRLSWALVARNSILAAALLAVGLAASGGRALVWLDLLTVAAGTGSLMLVWASVGRLFGVTVRPSTEAR